MGVCWIALHSRCLTVWRHVSFAPPPFRKCMKFTSFMFHTKFHNFKCGVIFLKPPQNKAIRAKWKIWRMEGCYSLSETKRLKCLLRQKRAHGRSFKLFLAANENWIHFSDASLLLDSREKCLRWSKLIFCSFFFFYNGLVEIVIFVYANVLMCCTLYHSLQSFQNPL